MFVRALPIVGSVIGLAACGGGGGGGPADAKPADAAPATVVKVTCPATPAATIDAPEASFSFVPNAATITQGQVVKFTMPVSHSVIPDPTAPANMTDPGLKTPFNMDTCLMFTKTGTFKFQCDPHGFKGTITVN